MKDHARKGAPAKTAPSRLPLQGANRRCRRGLPDPGAQEHLGQAADLDPKQGTARPGRMIHCRTCLTGRE